MENRSYPDDPTDEDALALFKTVEEKFPSKTVGNEKCYIVTVCLLSITLDIGVFLFA